MKIEFRRGTRPTWRASLIAVLTMSVCVPSFAHDPLLDEQEHDHAEHRGESDRSTDLAEARALIISFRETGDDRRLDEAWTLLESAIGDPETLITAAFVAQSRHKFTDALRLIEGALAINSKNDEGWLLLASIHLVRGETEPAATACGQLRNVPPLVLLTCKARVALATGDHRVALARLKGVINAADSQRLPADLRAWSYSVAGDLAVGTGETQQAVDLFQRSLGLAERTQVRAALIDVLLNEARYEDAWQALESGAPALPLLVRRLIVAKRLNRMHDLQPVLSTVQREFEVWIANEDWLHAREMTRFFIDVVDRPDLARRLAVINVGLQREPEDLRLERRTRPPAIRQSNAINSDRGRRVVRIES